MRRKGQSSKALAGKTPHDAFELSSWGQIYERNKGACKMVWDAQWVLDLITNHKRSELWVYRNDHPQNSVERQAVETFSEIVNQVMRCVKGKDGKFLRDLADAIESFKSGTVDPLRTFLLGEYFDLLADKMRQTKRTTFADLQSRLRRIRFGPFDPRHLRRVCSELGIVFTPGKPGRPRKK